MIYLLLTDTDYYYSLNSADPLFVQNYIIQILSTRQISYVASANLLHMKFVALD